MSAASADEGEGAAIRALTAAGGVMGEIIAAFDWSHHPLGPVQRWPQSLTTALRIVLPSHQPMFVWWGPELVNLYNDGYRAVLGGKHPWALGRPAAEVWPETWHLAGPRAAQVMRGEGGTYDEALRFVMERHGYPEEAYYTFSYSAIPDDSGVGGLLGANTDETQRVQGERELALLRALAVCAGPASTVREAAGQAALAVDVDRQDFPFSLFYELDPAAGEMRRLAHARAYEAERLRVQRLAQLDNAKTTFFTNVSHELRTPLTLILGPCEEAMADTRASLAPVQRERLALIRGNAVRLLRQVNALLEFTRLQAGQGDATFEPTDLVAYTAELASAFESAAGRAGIELVVDKSPLPEPVYIDRRLWETLVFNLLANALKFTRQGSITVRLRAAEGASVLEVEDTGIGIAAADQARLFERFYRVSGAQVHGDEGTGIGLALVQQITELHGGIVALESEPGRGSRIFVTLLNGKRHLPPDQIAAAPRSGWNPARAAAGFLEDAGSWLPLEPALPTAAVRPRVLLVEDNRDMRLYLSRILEGEYDVEAVASGEAALQALQRQRPELVLSDVMMPEASGFDLLHRIRASPESAGVPVILLSARAGEDAHVVGMEAGADDYLVKPFHVRELRARVGAHIKLQRLRQENKARLAAAERLHRELLENIGAALTLLDETLVIRYANRHFSELVRRAPETFMDMMLFDAFPEMRGRRFEESLRRAQRERTAAQVEELYSPLGAWFRIQAYPAPQGGLAVLVQETTGEKRQQSALLASEKLAAAGKLSATIAHEINNPLHTVMNLVYLSRMVPTRADEYLATAERELRRVAALANQTLSFYRRPSTPAGLNLPELLDAAWSIFEGKAEARGIVMIRRYGAVPDILGSASEMQQVFLNLISNAIDAMPKGGQLTLVVEPAMSTEAPGAWVRIGDTGAGLAPEARSRLFEPFFTTKTDVGTGLGLWIVQQIVTEHRGRIEAGSEAANGAGAVFSIFLPAAEALAA